MNNIFSAADILLPDFSKTDACKWSVIACDQFTGDPAYWEKAAQTVGDAPSTLRLILPELYLEEPDVPERIAAIQKTMQQYLDSGIFRTYPDAMIYVERIPPRMRVRADAKLELPHIMILIDDPEDSAIGSCTAAKSQMQALYDTELMNGGGSIRGWLMDKAQQTAFLDKLHQIEEASGELQYAMGDGNHSLATAKACYEALKQQHPGEDLSDHPARYALVELVNLHSEALQFEAIHRIITQTDPGQIMLTLVQVLGLSEEPSAQPVTIVRGDEKRELYIHKPTSNLAVGSLQNALDAYLSANPGKIDYIHGTETVERLAKMPDAIGFLLPDMDKRDLFPSVQKDGALPRKTFSMGHAEDKRYYMEARAIQ